MGGNALSTPSARMPRVVFVEFSRRCEEVLRAKFPLARVATVPSYRAKPDHGDLDLLVSMEAYAPAAVAEALGAVEVVRNGPVTSIGVPAAYAGLEGEGLFQVDLVYSPPEEFDFALGYFSFNDLGNLIGRTAHRMGLSLGQSGLWYFLRDGDYKFREILLTRDYGEALGFLGYSATRFEQGFDTLEDMFHYVAGSRYFNRSIFLLENRNAKSRIRDRKRRTYMEFLQFCEARPDLPAFEYPERKDAWLPKIEEAFPQFAAALAQGRADLDEQRVLKAKFNGDFVAKITGLQGPELGGFMKRFKDSFTTAGEMRAFLLAHSAQDIEIRVQRVLLSSTENNT